MDHSEQLSIALNEFYRNPTPANLACVDEHAKGYAADVGELDPAIRDEIRALHDNMQLEAAPTPTRVAAMLPLVGRQGVQLGALFLPWSLITFGVGLYLATRRESRRNKKNQGC